MKRSAVVAVLTAALLVSGCATQQRLLAPGTDPNQLAEAIARRGRNEGPITPEPPGSPVLGQCLVTGVKVTATCAVVAIAVALACAPGQHSGAGEAFGKALEAIWSTS
jgi:hypothetical protein